MPVKTFIKFLAVYVLAVLASNAKAQYYAYIEADGQQPFYLRAGEKIYSSNAAGFLILPRLDGSELAVKVGFPENVYPEVAFTMNVASRDRGYLLKLTDGVGWTLIEKGSALSVTGQVIGVSKESSPDKITAQPVLAAENSSNTNIKTKIDRKLLNNQSDLMEIVFFEQQSSGEVDTIYIQIPKSDPKKEISASVQSVSMPVKSGCTGASADVRDVRNLQKKMLGITTEDDQLALVVKTFSEKCFTCKQALEVAWFFVNEPARLKLFKQIQTLVADPARFPDLEEAFLSDDGISAFREMLGLKY